MELNKITEKKHSSVNTLSSAANKVANQLIHEDRREIKQEQ